MENIEEYATLKALGASQTFVARIVLSQALICGVLGSIPRTFLRLFRALATQKSLIPWIYAPWWLPAVMVVPSLLMCALASIASVSSALTVEPGRVFPCLIISWELKARVSPSGKERRVCLLFGMSH